MKRTSSFSAQTLVGVIFSLIGLPFLIMGIYFAAHMVWLSDHASGDVKVLPIVFCLLGGIFTLIGVCCAESSDGTAVLPNGCGLSFAPVIFFLTYRTKHQSRVDQAFVQSA